MILCIYQQGGESCVALYMSLRRMMAAISLLLILLRLPDDADVCMVVDCIWLMMVIILTMMYIS